jgi:hypothetical protein
MSLHRTRRGTDTPVQTSMGQRIQVKREEGCQLVSGKFRLLIIILVGTKIKFEVAENVELPLIEKISFSIHHTLIKKI